MKVVDDRRKPRLLPLYMLKVGRVFRYNDNYYIKTNEFNICIDSCKCVKVDDGQAIFFNRNINVEELEVELHIIDKEEE